MTKTNDPRIPGGATRREPVQAEFWKPKTPKDVLVGIVSSFGENSLGRHIVVSPAIVWPTGAEKPEGFASIAIGLNADLRRRINESVTGRAVTIVYTGQLATPKGAMRQYEVADIPMDEWTDYANRYAPGLLDATGAAPHAVDEEDDLPF